MRDNYEEYLNIRKKPKKLVHIMQYCTRKKLKTSSHFQKNNKIIVNNNKK